MRNWVAPLTSCRPRMDLNRQPADRIYTKGKGYRHPLGALVIAQHRENRLIDRGRVGSGISMKVLADLLILLRPLAEKNGVTWVDPNLQIEVSHFEETEGGHFRFPCSNGSWPKRNWLKNPCNHFLKSVQTCLAHSAAPSSPQGQP